MSTSSSNFSKIESTPALEPKPLLVLKSVLQFNPQNGTLLKSWITHAACHTGWIPSLSIRFRQRAIHTISRSVVVSVVNARAICPSYLVGQKKKISLFIKKFHATTQVLNDYQNPNESQN